MIQIGSSLGVSSSSTVFKTTINEKVWVRVGGTIGSAAVTIKESLDNSTFSAFVSDDTAQEFSAIGYKLFDLPGGVYFRLDVPAGGSPVLDIHIGGAGVRVI